MDSKLDSDSISGNLELEMANVKNKAEKAKTREEILDELWPDDSDNIYDVNGSEIFHKYC